MERVENRLERRGARAGSREHPERLRKVCRPGLIDQERDDTRGGQAADRGEVALQSRGAGQAAVPFVAVLNAHAVEKEQQAQRAQQPGRRRLRSKRPAGEADEEHSARAEREPFQIEFPDQVSDCDREKQGCQRRGLEDCPEQVHAAFSAFRSRYCTSFPGR
jgi:hypothetical protein